MQFHRTGQLDDRRRRVLTEEVIGAPPGAVEPQTLRPAGSGGHSTRYGDAALMQRQPRLIDFIPRSYGMVALALACGLAIVAGLEALYSYMPLWAHATTDGRIAAFDLDGEGSLAVWFSSATLALTALVALVVYSIRRHRQDDYHGRYRVWLWAAAVWMLMSIDEGGSLHEGFKELMAQLVGQRIFGDGSVYWIGAYGLLLGVVGVRLLLDMRECRLSTTALLAAGSCYAVAVVTQLGWILPESGARGVMLEEGCEMVGNLLLLTAMTLHARYVILEAEGVLPQRAVRKKPEKKAEVKNDLVSSKAAAAAKAPEPAAAAAEQRGWFGRKRKAAVAEQPATGGSEAQQEKSKVRQAAQPAKRSGSAADTAAEARRTRYDDEDDEEPSGGRMQRSGSRRFDDEHSDDDLDRRQSKAQRRAARRRKRMESD